MSKFLGLGVLSFSISIIASLLFASSALASNPGSTKESSKKVSAPKTAAPKTSTQKASTPKKSKTKLAAKKLEKNLENEYAAVEAEAVGDLPVAQAVGSPALQAKTAAVEGSDSQVQKMVDENEQLLLKSQDQHNQVYLKTAPVNPAQKKASVMATFLDVSPAEEAAINEPPPAPKPAQTPVQAALQVALKKQTEKAQVEEAALNATLAARNQGKEKVLHTMPQEDGGFAVALIASDKPAPARPKSAHSASEGSMKIRLARVSPAPEVKIISSRKPASVAAARSTRIHVRKLSRK